MIDVYLGLGSNLGDRRDHLARALERLAAHGVQLVRVSPVVESPAMLPDDAPVDWNQPFLNLVAHCRTDAAPTDVLDGLKAIERELGRVDRGRWAPRPIDLDLLLYGRETLATDRLRVPHPGITERAFVLTPLAALEPRLTIPGHGTRTVLEHARAGGHHLPLWMGIVNLDARLVLRRRRARRRRFRGSASRGARRPTAPSSSTSAPNRRGPARRR